MAAKLRPRVILPWFVSSTAAAISFTCLLDGRLLGNDAIDVIGERFLVLAPVSGPPLLYKGDLQEVAEQFLLRVPGFL